MGVNTPTLILLATIALAWLACTLSGVWLGARIYWLGLNRREPAKHALPRVRKPNPALDDDDDEPDFALPNIKA